MDKKQLLNDSEKLVEKAPPRPPNRQSRQKPVPQSSDKSFLKTYKECRSALVAFWQDAIEAHRLALIEGGLDGIRDEGLIRADLARPYHGYHHWISRVAKPCLKKLEE